MESWVAGGGVGLVVVGSLKPLVAVLLFGLTAGHLFWRAIRLRGTDHFLALSLCCGGTLVLLLLLMVATLFYGPLRAEARNLGLYQDRRPVQRTVTKVVACVAPLAAIGGGWYFGRRRAFLAGVVISCWMMLSVGVLKIVSYHPMDEILVFRIMPGVSVFHTLIAISLFGMNLSLLGCQQEAQVT